MKKRLVLFTTLLYMIFWSLSTVYGANIVENEYSVEVEQENNEQEGAIVLDHAPWPEIVAPSACLMDAKNGFLLYDKNKDQIRFPASITKVMTALLAIEYLEDNGWNLQERILMSKEAVYGVPSDASKIYMDVGETLTMEQALHAIMLVSANEVCIGIAEHIAGTKEAFAERMTQRARELGAKDTNFTNPHGLHDEEHYTTAYDMALIMKEAVSHEYFKQLIATRRYIIPPTEKMKEPRILLNSNKLIHEGNPYYYEYVVGSKTGFTDQARHTLVSYIVKDGAEMVCVVLYDDKFKSYTDTMALVECGFERYEEVCVLEESADVKQIPVYQKEGDGEILVGEVSAIPFEAIYLNAACEVDQNAVIKQIDLPDKLYSPLKRGEVIGTITLLYGNNQLGQTELVCAWNVEPDWKQIEELKEEVLPVALSADKPVTENMSRENAALVEDARWLQQGILLLVLFLLLLLLFYVVRRKLRRRKRIFGLKAYKLPKRLR